MRFSRTLRICLIAAAALVACAQFLPGTWSSFTDSTASAGNTVTAAADWTGPVVSAIEFQKAEGGATDKVRQGGTFYVYANVADSGNPASGVATVTASVGNVATVSTAALSAGTWTVGGVTYGYRSAQLTAKNPLTSGSYSYSVGATDAGGYAGAAVSATVTVDNTAFNGTDFTTANKTGGIAGKPEAGDKVTFVYNKAPEPASILAGWDGTATSVPVKMYDGALYGLTSTQDLFAVYDAAGVNVLGTGYAMLNGDYIVSSKAVTFSSSSMVITGNTIVVTLGTPDVAANTRTDSNNRLPVWTPYANAYDQWANAAGTANVTQSGLAKKQF